VRRLATIFGLVILFLAASPFISFGGQRLVGFQYGVGVNNLNTECPNTVTAVDGRRITLDDGRRFLIDGPSETDLAAELAQCDHRVRIDPSDDALYTARPIDSCSFSRPERCQMLTIPLVRVDLRQYTSRRVYGVAHPRNTPRSP
jgi:hypothetical protein